jgi:hypothetical protein
MYTAEHSNDCYTVLTATRSGAHDIIQHMDDFLACGNAEWLLRNCSKIHRVRKLRLGMPPPLGARAHKKITRKQGI